MILHAGDLDAWQQWRDHPDPEDPLHLADPDLLVHLSGSVPNKHNIWTSAAFRDGLREARTRTGYPLGNVKGESAGHPYRFIFKVPVEAPQTSHGRYEYGIRVGDHELRGWLDGLIGSWNQGVLVSTTRKSIVLDRVLDSWRWRSALVALPMLEAIRCEVYRIAWKGGNMLTVLDQRTLDQHRYEGMRREVGEVIHRCATTLRDMGWWGRGHHQ